MSDTLNMQSPHMVGRNIEQIAALFSHCVIETAEGKAIDFDLLWQELSSNIRDASFANDTAKENVKQLLKQLSPDTEMKVL